MASAASLSAIILRSAALSAFPTRVSGNASTTSIRSGSLYLAMSIRSRNSPISVTLGAGRSACMMMKAQAFSP